MDMDLTYFESTAPVIQTMTTVIIAMGWALLLGNLFYQALRTMLHGAGFESEDPKILACRTMAFAFLLIVSQGTEAPPPAVTQPSAVTPSAVQGGSNSRQDIRPDIRAVPPVTPASPRPVTPASSQPAAPASSRPVTPASSRPVAPASPRPAASAPANAGKPPTPAPAQTAIPKTPTQVQPSHRGGYQSYSNPIPGTNQSSESGKNNRENDKGR